MFDVLAAVKLIQAKLSGELQVRYRTSLVLAPAVLLITIIGGLWFNVMILAASLLMMMEWQAMTANIEGDSKVREKWQWRGIAYVSVSAASLLWLRYMQDYSGRWAVIWLMVVVWATDIAAYFTGTTVGGARLAPSISPGKTWAGLIGGVVAAALVGMFFGVISGMPSVMSLFLWSALTALVAQGGDLLESYVKRLCGVKDSGDLIPGHGGILDRVDGLVTAAPFAMILFMLAR